MIALTETRKSDRIVRVKDGWAACPICGNGRLKLVRPDETAELVYIHCRRCKHDIPLMLKPGQCFQSQGQPDPLCCGHAGPGSFFARGGFMSSKQRADHVGETRTAYLKNARRVIMAGEVCGICGRPVDKSLKYPDPMAPSVDHIIPISRGGHPSDIDNLQLTHWCCNHAKSDRLTAAPPRPWQAGPSVSNRNLPQHVDWGNYRGDTTP